MKCALALTVHQNKTAEIYQTLYLITQQLRSVAGVYYFTHNVKYFIGIHIFKKLND